MNLSQYTEDGRPFDTPLYFDPHDFMPKFIINLCESMGDNYVIENMPSMHREHAGLSKSDAEMLFIKEASEICPHNLHMYSLYKSNPSSFAKKASTVNSHFNAFFHGHHFNSSINSNSSHSSTMTNHSSTVSGSLASHSNLSGHSSTSQSSKDAKVWLAISATGVQIFEQERQVFINKSNSSGYLDANRPNQSLDSRRHPKDRLQDQPSTSVFYLRNKLSTFVWSDIEKLFFDKKKFEIRSNGYPVRRFTYYTHSDEMAKNLLWLCKFSHRFQLFIQPKLKEMKKRESELSRRKYRESYIYSENGDAKGSPANEKAARRNTSWMEYQQEPTNKYVTFTNSNPNSLTASRNTLVGKESLNLSNQSKDFHLRPLSDDMKPIMDQFDRQISKLQFNSSSDHNLIDLSASSNVPAKSNQQPANGQMNNLPSNGIAEESPMKKSERPENSTNKADFMSGLDNALYFNQLNTNPFLNKSDYNQASYPPMFAQPQQNLDEFVIEHKAHGPSDQRTSQQLTVQPSSLQIKINEQTSGDQVDHAVDHRINHSVNHRVDHADPLDQTVEHINNTFPLTNDKATERKSRQTFSLESLTCSNLSEPSSSGISEQEFSTSSCASANLLENRKSGSQLPSHLNHNQNNESPNSMQSRCSSNTSYSSDSALGKCSSKPPISQPKPTMIPRMTAGNYVKASNVAQKKPRHFALSANDLRKQLDATKEKDSFFSTINNNHLLADFNNRETNTEVREVPKPRARKSKFELKHKNKMNGMYKSLPNVNDFGGQSRFGRLDAIEQTTDGESERFNFLNRSDKSTSSEQSVSTIKSNTNCSSSSGKPDGYSNNPFLGTDSRSNWYQTNVTSNLVDGQRQVDPSRKAQVYENIYENLPFQQSVNSLLNGNRTPTTSHSFVPAPHLITTTPNRIATKIGVSSLNRCNKLNSPHYSNHKSHNLRLNLFNNGMASPFMDRANMRTCSYQLLNAEHLSTINDPNQSTPFKTTRASSDPGVLTYSSTGNLMKIQSKDSCVFYQNGSPTGHRQNNQPVNPLSFHNFGYQNASPFHRSLNNLNDDGVAVNHLAYDQPLLNQISNQRKASIRKNQNFPMRLAESELNLISDDADQQRALACLPPPAEYASGLEKKAKFANYPGSQLLMNGKLKATSEQQLNQPINQKMSPNKLNKPTDSIDNLQQLKQKSQDLDLPLITTLFNDRSLMINGIKTVPGKSRQKPKRYSLHLDNSATSELNQSNQSTNGLNASGSNVSGSNSNEPAAPSAYHQTNLDEPSIFDAANLHLKIDKNYNNLESNNLNAPFSAQNSRAEIIDKIWSDHFLN